MRVFAMNAKMSTPRMVCTLLAGGILLLVAVTVALAVGNIDTTNKWAWGTNVGWINFNPDNGGVTVYDDHLEGYAWGENIGWIRLGTCTTGSPCTHANTAATDYGVNNDGDGNLSGYAWGTNVGWINFDPDGDERVTIDPDTGDFNGYAWGENIGWIHFQNADPAYKISTTWSPTAVSLAWFTATSRAGGILLEWETAIEVDTVGFNLYRANSPTGVKVRLNETLIPAQAPGSPVGDRYEWSDNNGLFVGQAYFYWLEAVDLHGQSQFFGPVDVTARVWYRVFLPLISR
jgi:hypothetical protein